MKDLFGQEVKQSSESARTPKEIRQERARKYGRPRGHAAPPGSGPEGETCGSCENCAATFSNARKKFYKCALVKQTKGAATDIRLKHLACSRWEQRKDEPLE